MLVDKDKRVNHAIPCNVTHDELSDSLSTSSILDSTELDLQSQSNRDSKSSRVQYKHRKNVNKNSAER